MSLSTVAEFNALFSTANSANIYNFQIDQNNGGTNPTKNPATSSYVNTTFSELLPQGCVDTLVYNGWCADMYDTINAGTLYDANIYSMLDPAILDPIISNNPFLTAIANGSHGTASDVYINHMGALLYLLNKVGNDAWTAGIYTSEPTVTPSNPGFFYESADVQSALWTLLFMPTSYPYSGPVAVATGIVIPVNLLSTTLTSTQTVLDLINLALYMESITLLSNIPLLFTYPTMGAFMIETIPSVQILFLQYRLCPQDPPCFLAGTQVLVYDENNNVYIYKNIQDINPGTIVKGVSGKNRKVIHCGWRKIRNVAKRCLPRRIPKDIFGENIPSVDVYVSGQHIIYAPESAARDTFTDAINFTESYFIDCKPTYPGLVKILPVAMRRLDVISTETITKITKDVPKYYHIVLDKEDGVYVSNLAAETLPLKAWIREGFNDNSTNNKNTCIVCNY